MSSEIIFYAPAFPHVATVMEKQQPRNLVKHLKYVSRELPTSDYICNVFVIALYTYQ